MSTRAKFKSGKIKLLQFLADQGMNFTTEVRRAVNNIFESGDKKIDADMAVDDMFENLGIDRDAVDQKDVLKVYDEALDLLSVPPGSRGGPDDIAAPFSDEKVDLPEGVDPRDTILPTGNIKYKPGDAITSENFGDSPFAPDTSGLKKGKKLTDVKTDSTGNLVSRQIKIMNAADRIKPGLFENITEEQIDILVKYADRIDDDLLRNIVLDPDPNNRAAAVATLEQADALMDQGKSIDEVMSILQSTPRRKQAEGGLSYLMGM